MPPPLHFQRIDFTQDTYEAMASGFAPHRSLFGQRRIGKTTFLLHDLGPKAEQFGHRVAYVDFWERGPAPLALLLYELDRSLSKKSGVQRVVSGLRDLAPRVYLNALGVEVALDLTHRPTSVPEDQVLLLGQYLERLAQLRRPSFLFFDEFQELARMPDSETVMAALRAGLSRHQGALATVFTGSSQSRLKAVFSKKSAPFYRFATRLDLPPLDGDFVVHQLGHYPKSAPTLTQADAMQVFEHFGRNPEYFQRWMRLRAVTPGSDPEVVSHEIEREIAEELDFERIWLSLSDRHRLVLRLIAAGRSDLFGAEIQAEIKALTDAPAPSASQLQTAYNTLENRDLVDAWEGERQITDPLLQRWIMARPISDFRH